jgi:lysophospholipase L1-like esterase
MRAFFFLSCAIFVSHTAYAQYDSLYLKNRSYHLQRGLHSVYRTTHADVVMLGNSITFGANWSELLGRTSIANRGIGGDNTYGFLNRMDDIVTLKPKLCFIMGGINDIFADIPVDSVYRNYVKILEMLRSKSIIPVVQSTLHVSPKWKRAEEKNPVVTELNSRLRTYAELNNIEYLDVDALLSADGALRDENTFDGVHLTAPAYVRWAALVDDVLKKHGL